MVQAFVLIRLCRMIIIFAHASHGHQMAACLVLKQEEGHIKVRNHKSLL